MRLPKHMTSVRERELFIGTQCSNLYTLVDTPAKGRVFEPENVVRSVLLRWQSSGKEVRRGLAVGLQKEKTQKLAVHAGGCA